MRSTILLVIFVLSISACFAPSSRSVADEAAATASSDEKKSADKDAPKPDDVLRQMADYLSNLSAFSCKIHSDIRIQMQGMDNRMETKMTARLERPNRIAMIVEEGIMGLTIVSDGKQLIQYMPMLQRYTVSEAPADFAELKESMPPFGGAMMGGSVEMIPTNGEEFYNGLVEGVTESEYVGTEKIDDIECHHCRFKQEKFQWDIWIETGERPVVHKIVPDMSQQFAEAGGRMEGAKMEFAVTLSDWNVEPKFTDADFAFEPPAEAQEVESLFGGGGGGQEAGPHPLLGQDAPTFETVDLAGEPIDLKQHLGKDVVMLDFWATWCGPCVEALPQVDAAAEKFADQGVAFYAVNSREDTETIKEFLTSSKLDIPVAMDPEGTAGDLYQVSGIPQTVLIGKDGKVQVVHIGYSETLGEELTKQIEELLAGKDLAGPVLEAAERHNQKADEDDKAATTEAEAETETESDVDAETEAEQEADAEVAP